jgi:hypothetical protein
MSKLQKSAATFFLLITLTLSTSGAEGWMSTAGWMSTGVAPSPSPTPTSTTTTDVEQVEERATPEETPEQVWELVSSFFQSALSLF